MAQQSRYHETYARWRHDPEAFWAEAAREIDWYKPWEKVFDPYAGQYGRWFVGAECNTAWNCLDRHVERGRRGIAGIECGGRLAVEGTPVASERGLTLYNPFYDLR